MPRKAKLLTGTPADFKDGARIRQLSPVEFDELKRVIGAGASHTDVSQWLASHGLVMGDSRVHNVRDRIQRAIAQLKSTELAVSELAKATNVDQSLRAVGGILTNVVIAAQNPDDPESQKSIVDSAYALTGIRNAELRAQEGRGRMETKRHELALAERKVKLLEEREAKARAVVADLHLSDAEKTARMKQVFGL